MNSPAPTERFASFPLRQLLFGAGRRAFFRGFALEMLGLKDMARGRGVFSLADLGTAAAPQLGHLVPVIRQDLDFVDDPQEVRCRIPPSDQTLTLFKRSLPALSAFNAMNGGMTLSEIALKIGEETGWPESESFAYVRGLFLTLVEAQVCRPVNSLTSPAAP